MIATAFWGNLWCFCFLFCLLTSGLIVEVMDHVSETPLTPVMHQRCQQLHVKTFLPNPIPAPVDLLPFLGCVSRSSGCNRSLFFKASSSCLSHSLCPGAFQLRYWSRGEKEDMASVQRTVGNQTSTVIRGVKGSTTYYVSVRAYNTAGTGPPSSTVNVTTKKPRKYLMKPSAISTRLVLYFSWIIFFFFFFFQHPVSHLLKWCGIRQTPR